MHIGFPLERIPVWRNADSLMQMRWPTHNEFRTTIVFPLFQRVTCVLIVCCFNAIHHEHLHSETFVL